VVAAKSRSASAALVVLLAATASLADESTREKGPAAPLDLGSIAVRADWSRAAARGASSRSLDRSGREPAYIGSFGGDGEFFAGALDDVRIWDRALTSEEAGQLATAASPPPTRGLIAHWALDGDLANSAERGPRDAGKALGDPPRLVAGRLGKAVHLDGATQTIRIAHHDDLKPERAITFAAWILPDVAPDRWMEIYRKDDGNARHLLALGRTGYFGLWCGLGIGGSYVERGARLDRKAILDGRWHHVAATFDGRLILLYLDGREIGRHDTLSQPQPIEVVPPDDRLRVAFLGNTLIDRAIHFGYLEHELTRAWPDRDIVFRNLGWPGDDVDGNARAGFGPGEHRRSGWQRPRDAFGDYGFRRLTDHLRRTRPDIVLVGYGSNVAFGGAAGLARFETGLDRLLDLIATAGARAMLLSPPPRETREPGSSDMAEQNAWLERVATHLGKIATQRGLPYVDLFSAFREQQRNNETTLQFTDNGLHLNDHGYRVLAALVARAMGVDAPRPAVHLRADGSVEAADACRVESVRHTPFGMRIEVVNDRLPSLASTDGGGVVRVEGLASGVYALDLVGQRVARGTAEQWARGIAVTRGPHLERTERLRAAIIAKNRLFFYRFRPQNKTYIYLFRRHERGHHEGEIAQYAALVREKEDEIAQLRRPRSRQFELVREHDYSAYDVPRDIPRPNLDEELASFKAADGFEVNLFASNPMVANPNNINWDERGRMWVTGNTVYPLLTPGEDPNDFIAILEDVDGDGVADKSTVFADGLLVPHSVMPSRNGAFITQSTDLLFLEDTDGDDRADRRRVVLTGFGNADVHQMIHGLRWGPGGDLYFNQSIYINSHVETPWGVSRLNAAGVWRLRPEQLRLEVHARGMTNPWGHAFDRWGQSFGTDGAGGGGLSYTFPGAAFPSAHDVARTIRSLHPGRPKECGLEALSGRHLPESWRGDFITADFRANRIVRYRLTENGSGYSSRLLGDVLWSSHKSFRPVDMKLGPDGAIYIADWYNSILGHGEVDFHHPLRDHRHGRIWRLTVKGRPLVERPKLHEASVDELLAALALPEAWTRDQARRLLRQRGAKAVVERLGRWVEALDAGDPEIEHHRLEALWVYQGVRVPAPELLRSVLQSPDHRVRAAAVRVLGDWHDRVTDSVDLFAAAVADDHAQVRLEVVNALRAIGTLEAVETAMRAVDRQLDGNLDYAAWLTARELESLWLPALEAGKPVFDGKPDRLAFALSAVGKAASLRPLVDLVRAGKLSDRERRSALELIAGLGEPDDVVLVLDAAASFESADPRAAAGILAALKSGAQRGRPVPPNAARVASLLDADDEEVSRLAVDLAGLWKIDAARAAIGELVAASRTHPTMRSAAARALARFGDGPVVLSALSTNGASTAVRIAATSAWAAIDPEGAAPTAVRQLAAAKDDDSIDALFEAFVGRREGDAILAKAIDGTKLSAATAAVGIRVAESSGRDMAALVDVLTRAGSLGGLTAMPPSDELATLVQAVHDRGDAARGEEVFRRASLRCTTCHAIGGGGGRVGPDLSSLGGSSQVVRIIQSLLEPSAEIKEGYETVVVFDARSGVHSGTVAYRGRDEIRVRDANDRVVAIPTAQAQAVTGSDVSVMPRGLAQDLRRDELVDVVRFLSELGVSESYSVPTERFVRTWSVQMRESWSTAYSRVDGSLPLDEIPASGASRPFSVVRAVVRPDRPVVLRANDPRGLFVGIGGRRQRLEATGIELSAGTHEVEIFFQRDERTAPLRIELRDRP